MRLWILSDLHIESCVWEPPVPRPTRDVLVAAGDIGSPASEAVRWLAERADGRPVVFVPGNHEWYAPGRSFDVGSELARARACARENGVHLLLMDAVVLDGVRFLGTTLWTDYELHGAPERDAELASFMMNDHRLIFPDPSGPPLDPARALAWHRAERAWLEQQLARPFDGKTVVVTHHLPHPRSIAPAYVGHPITPAFCSDLSPLVERGGAALWIHGHTHSSMDYQTPGARVLCNPKGYGPRSPGGRMENPGFDPRLVVSV